jgi:hypothetical protein
VLSHEGDAKEVALAKGNVLLLDITSRLRRFVIIAIAQYFIWLE